MPVMLKPQSTKVISPVMPLASGRAEEEGGVADLGLFDVAVQRGARGDGGEDLGEVADAAGGEGFDGAGGDGVDADVFGAEGDGEVADGGFERGLGDAHDVVVGEDFFRAVVGQGQHGSAFGHEGRGAAGECDEGVDADIVGDAEVLARGEQEIFFEGVGGSKADGVDEDIDLRVGGGDLREERVDVLVAGDVALEGAADAGLAQVVEQFFGFALEAFGLVREDQGRSGLGQLLSYAVGNAALICQAEDDGHLSLQIDHSAPSSDSSQYG